MAEDALSVLQSYSTHITPPTTTPDQVDLFGVSMGGMVSLQLSSLLSNSNSKFTVRNLVLGCTTLGGSSSDPPPFPPPDPTFFSTFSSFRNDGSDADHAICHAFLSKILGESFINSRGGKLALKRLTSKFIESHEHRYHPRD